MSTEKTNIRLILEGMREFVHLAKRGVVALEALAVTSESSGHRIHIELAAKRIISQLFRMTTNNPGHMNNYWYFEKGRYVREREVVYMPDGTLIEINIEIVKVNNG